MITLLFILLKFSLAIVAIWGFYKLFLEKLTFFVSNRYFFLSSLPIAMLMAIGRFEWIDNLFKSQFSTTNLVQYVPSVSGQQFFNPFSRLLPLSGILLTIYVVGVVGLGLHFIIQYLSYLKLKRGAYLTEIHGQEVYVVQPDILPFSFGKSIFIAESALDNPEIEKILLHESIHIEQNHSIDVLVAELVRIINWINPFAWWLKTSMRENLEFLTDARIINKGIDKKNYQYLLLHFSGNNPLSLVTNFNFYSLKTRISKMNQNKSNRLQYARFLLFVPVILVLMFVISCINEQATDEAPIPKTQLKAFKTKLDEPKLALKINELKQQYTSQLKLSLLDKMQKEPEIKFDDAQSKEVIQLKLSVANETESKKYGITSDKTEKTPPPPPPPVPANK